MDYYVIKKVGLLSNMLIGKSWKLILWSSIVSLLEPKIIRIATNNEITLRKPGWIKKQTIIDDAVRIINQTFLYIFQELIKKKTDTKNEIITSSP